MRISKEFKTTALTCVVTVAACLLMVWSVNALLDNNAEVTALKQSHERLISENHALTHKVNYLEQDVPKGYKPNLALSDKQNTLCLAIGMFGEARSMTESALSREFVGWSIIARAEDVRDDSVYRPSVCGVLMAKKQYSSMGAYKKDLKNIVWGEITEFTPWLAEQSYRDMQAWRRILLQAKQIINGELTRKTTATHFISFANLVGKAPSWVSAFLPAAGPGDGLHVFFTDHIRVKGRRVILTKEKPITYYKSYSL